MSGLEIAPLVMSVLPPAIEYFFAQDAVTMDEEDVHPDDILLYSEAPQLVFPSRRTKRTLRHHKSVQVTSLSLE